jgi:hypothetical protein
MPFYSSSFTRLSFEAALAPFLNEDGLPFADVLPAEQVEQACQDEGVHFGATSRSVYNPAVVLWTFLSQVLGADRSCRAATMRVLPLCIALGRGPCSTDTGMYCRAREKLPVPLVRRLTYEVADEAEQAVPSHWLWKGRHVHLVDGTTVSAPDTTKNQEVYPQPPGQKPGLGFPMIRLVVLLSLATAMCGGLAYGPYEGKETGETALLRSLLPRLRPGSVLLADRYYCTYFMVALLRERGVDVVMRMHHLRDVDFRRGCRLGRDDHLILWYRPDRPEWMDEATYERMPCFLPMREVRAQIAVPGFRVNELDVATTLLNPEAYSREEIADLYHERWHVELDIRSIKSTLGMDVLRCRTPQMLERELWTTFLGYNLVRKVSCQAALLAGKHPRQISFKGTLQAVQGSWEDMTKNRGGNRRVLAEAVLVAAGKEVVGDRPNRCEPRAAKRRPKKQKLLTKPRRQARAELLGN